MTPLVPLEPADPVVAIDGGTDPTDPATDRYQESLPSMSSPFDRLRVNGLTEPVGLDADRVRLAWQPRSRLPEHDTVVVEIAQQGSSAERRHQVRPGDTAAVLEAPEAGVWRWRVGRESPVAADWAPWQRVVATPPPGLLDDEWIAHPGCDGARLDGRRPLDLVLDTTAHQGGRRGGLSPRPATGTLDVRLPSSVEYGSHDYEVAEPERPDDVLSLTGAAG